jgi:hypothetical protein
MKPVILRAFAPFAINGERINGLSEARYFLSQLCGIGRFCFENDVEFHCCIPRLFGALRSGSVGQACNRGLSVALLRPIPIFAVRFIILTYLASTMPK